MSACPRVRPGFGGVTEGMAGRGLVARSAATAVLRRLQRGTIEPCEGAVCAPWAAACRRLPVRCAGSPSLEQPAAPPARRHQRSLV